MQNTQQERKKKIHGHAYWTYAYHWHFDFIMGISDYGPSRFIRYILYVDDLDTSSRLSD